jgi:hypothetical protein
MRSLQLTVTLALLASAAPAVAQDTPADWLKRPTPEMLKELYPTAAAKKGEDGQAVIGCIVTVQGLLRACKVLDESPAGLDFGAAGLAIAPQLVFKPAIKGGKPTESFVRIPINWKNMAGMPRHGPAAQSDKVYTNLPWREAPTIADVRAAYPAKAASEKVGGVAIIDCRIGSEGRLSRCETVRESPRGHGFAGAAKTLAPLFVTPVKTADGGTAVGARAHVSVAFSAESLDTPVIGRPKWVQTPQINDLEAVMPPAARKAGIYKARTSLECQVIAGGAVDGCTVVSQDPPGLGYGDAALMLARFFKLAVWTDEGLPSVGGKVSIPLRFDLPQPETTSAAAPSRP